MRSACVCPARHAPSLAWDAWAAHAWPAGAAWRGVHAWEGPARGCTGELPKWGVSIPRPGEHMGPRRLGN